LAVLAFAYARGGEREKALKTLNEINELAKQKYVSPFSKSIALTDLRENDAAIDELEKACHERSDTMAIINVYQLLDNLRSPRFVKLQQVRQRIP
jgi:Tfp pilus assembly protein PilF